MKLNDRDQLVIEGTEFYKLISSHNRLIQRVEILEAEILKTKESKS